jgi:hypothetical protein
MAKKNIPARSPIPGLRQPAAPPMSTYRPCNSPKVKARDRGVSKRCRAKPVMTARVIAQGNRAQGAIKKAIIALTAMKVREKARPVGGEREPSARGLWRISARGPLMSKSRSA